MNAILWVDDVRNPPSDLNCDIARNVSEAQVMLASHDYDTIYLDHDLAEFHEDRELTGYNLVLWLVQRKQDGFNVPTKYHLLTANPVGRSNMQFLIDRYLS